VAVMVRKTVSLSARVQKQVSCIHLPSSVVVRAGTVVTAVRVTVYVVSV
jgi:hypothetical protein